MHIRPIDSDPLIAPPPAEVPLRDAPLVRVLAQVRFPLIVAVERSDFIVPFQEAIRSEYPVLRPEQIQGVLLGVSSTVPPQVQTIWRFADIPGHWRVSLTSSFLALETTAYRDRGDFLERLQRVVQALDKHVEPRLVDRLGIRYINRVAGGMVDDMVRLVRPEVRGILGTQCTTHLQHTLTESVFALEGARVSARWGWLPPLATVDPGAIEPIDEPSWILDFDMVSTDSAPLDVDRITGDAKRFSERIYALFRWAVTEEFLRRYGGEG